MARRARELSAVEKTPLENLNGGFIDSPPLISLPIISVHARPVAAELRKRKIIVCIPVFNDWDCAILLLNRIDRVVKEQQWNVSVLLVDDGSTDESPDSWPEQLQAIEEVNILKLRRNVGHQRAIALGLTYIHSERSCDAVIVMDGDGEDSPDAFPELLERFALHQGRRVIFAKRARRSEGVVFRLFYQFYKLVHRVLTGRTVEVGNFSVIPAVCLNCLVGVSELWNHYAASVFKSRLPVDMVPIPRAHRLCGESKMNFVSLVTHGLSAISVFGEQVSTRLMVGSSIAGALALFGLATTVVIRFCTNAAILGWATYTMGLLVTIFLNALLLSLISSVLVLQSRNNTSFLPLRDYQYYISGVKEIAVKATPDQRDCCVA